MPRMPFNLMFYRAYGVEQEFWQRVEQGFQVTPTWHQGFVVDNGRLEDLLLFLFMFNRSRIRDGRLNEAVICPFWEGKPICRPLNTFLGRTLILSVMYRSKYAKTVETVRWEYSTEPIYGWGDIGYDQKATAGWLAAFPFFEPHWQVCMAGGLSTGTSTFCSYGG